MVLFLIKAKSGFSASSKHCQESGIKIFKTARKRGRELQSLECTGATAQNSSRFRSELKTNKLENWQS